MPPRSVLHVLPHPGGGGETYVDSLAEMAGYDHSRFFLAASRSPLAAAPSLAANVPRANLRARRFDIVHVHGEVAAFLCLPALAGVPSVVTLHGLHFVKRSTRIRGQFAKANLRLVVRTATRTICVAEEERREAVRFMGNSLATKLAVVPNGVAIPLPPTADERRSIRAELGVDDRIVVVSVGSLDPPKDPLTPAHAVTALARAGSSVVLLLVGDGSLRASVEDIARGSTGAVRALGQRDDITRLVAASDLFVLSTGREGLPYALLEAMAAGLPSVVSDYPGASEVVGDAGILVPEGDIEGFRSAIGRLAADASLRASLGDKARRRIKTRLSLEQMLDGTRQVYEEVV